MNLRLGTTEAQALQPWVVHELATRITEGAKDWEAKTTRVNSTNSNSESPEATPEPLKSAQVTCVHGYTDNSECSFCRSDGACTALLYPSIPPQYARCPFKGSGWIKF